MFKMLQTWLNVRNIAVIFAMCILFQPECTFGFGLSYWHNKYWEEFITIMKAAVALCALLHKRGPCTSEEQSPLLLMLNVCQGGCWAWCGLLWLPCVCFLLNIGLKSSYKQLSAMHKLPKSVISRCYSYAAVIHSLSSQNFFWRLILLITLVLV